MPNHTYQPIIVTGINSGGSTDQEEILQAHARALALFDRELVSALTPVGHNFVQSFCVFPTGSGNERPGQMTHRRAVTLFVEYLSQTDLEFVALHWDDDDDEPMMVSHADYSMPHAKPK